RVRRAGRRQAFAAQPHRSRAEVAGDALAQQAALTRRRSRWPQAVARAILHARPLRLHSCMPVLRFDNVSKLYPGGHAALAEVSFAVDAGEMLFVTGHSGAGKSTLLKLIQLAERPSRG